MTMTGGPQDGPADLFDFDWYKHVRKEGPDTSRQSAQQAEGLAQRHAGMVVQHLNHNGPSTSDEIADAIGLLSHQVMKRTTDLKDAGRIEDSGERRKGHSGRQQIVWRLKRGDGGQ